MQIRFRKPANNMFPKRKPEREAEAVTRADSITISWMLSVCVAALRNCRPSALSSHWRSPPATCYPTLDNHRRAKIRFLGDTAPYEHSKTATASRDSSTMNGRVELKVPPDSGECKAPAALPPSD